MVKTKAAQDVVEGSGTSSIGAEMDGGRITMLYGCWKERESRIWAGTMLVSEQAEALGGSARNGIASGVAVDREEENVVIKGRRNAYLSAAILSIRSNDDFRFRPDLRPLWPGSKRSSLA